jgi:hypothetical protein
LQIFFPFSTEPDNPLKVIIKRDAIVEEVIGYILYQYIENEREPKLVEGLCQVIKWTLRIVEDDGEIDDDFPGWKGDLNSCL